MGEIRIGTSGWNYPSGQGTWNGIFYPASAKGSARQGRTAGKFDELRFYAEHFDTVEVNSTFYRVVERFDRRTRLVRRRVRRARTRLDRSS